jgi:hypothetical protein
MMGANWRPDPKQTINERFAWWPVKSTWSKKLIWLAKYIQMEVYHDSEMSNPIRSNTFTFVYSKNEYLLYLLRNSEGSGSKNPLPPKISNQASP